MLKYITINLKHSKSLQFETMNPNLNNWIRDKDNKDNKMKKKWQTMLKQSNYFNCKRWFYYNIKLWYKNDIKIKELIVFKIHKKL